MDYELCRDIYATSGMGALLAALASVAPKDRTEATLAAAQAVGDVISQGTIQVQNEAEKRQMDSAYWQIVMPLNTDDVGAPTLYGCQECGAGGGGDPYGECCCYEDDEDQAA